MNQSTRKTDAVLRSITYAQYSLLDRSYPLDKNTEQNLCLSMVIAIENNRLASFFIVLTKINEKQDWIN